MNDGMEFLITQLLWILLSKTSSKENTDVYILMENCYCLICRNQHLN